MATTFAIAAFIVGTILLIRINQIGDRYWDIEFRQKELERKVDSLERQVSHLYEDLKKVR